MIWNHMSVVKVERNVIDNLPDCTSIVWPGILRIAMFTIYCGFDELLGIMLATLPINHARCPSVHSSTGTMQHAIGDCFIEKRILIWIRKLSRHDIIYLVCIQYLVIWVKPDEGMHVGKAMLLEFCGVDQCLNSSKQSISYILQGSILLQLKDMHNNVRTIRSMLFPSSMIGTWGWRNLPQQVVLNIWPVWIGSHGVEDVRLAKSSSNGHSILEKLGHMTLTTRKTGRENKPSTMFCHIYVVVIITQDSISKS